MLSECSFQEENSPDSAHTRAAACLLRLYSIVNWNWLQLAVLEHRDKIGWRVATIRQPVYAHLSHWIWFMWSLNLSAAVILISSNWLTHNWEEILPTVGCVVSSAKKSATNAVLQSKLGYHLVHLLSFKATIFCNTIACSCRVASDQH